MTKKLGILRLFNSCGGGCCSYYPSIWHPSIPYSNQFHFQKEDNDGDMLVIKASNHTGSPEGNSDYWVTSRGHKNVIK